MSAENAKKLKPVPDKGIKGKTGAEAEGHLARDVEIENVVKTSGDPESKQDE
ncbi:hypothetical protein [Cohnella kolymensis]|uniref:hypothetical protein n=1 Tax=Cohnella kolymensis TaxID=1590652 RepID=UPI000A7D479C|nr:hypothetical protein [Cohnella kolymensis]